jgi:hypothetical protein
VTGEPRWRRAEEFDPPLDTGADVYRRRITVRTLDDRRVECNLEDDFHHFVVTLTHDSERVVDVTNESHRWPWATCPGAGEHLRLLVDAPLSSRFTHAARAASAQRNCTHQFDAAAHAFTQAATGRTYRQYDAQIASLLTRSEAGRNRLWVDGQLVHDWEMTAGRGPRRLPAALEGAPWKGGFMRWADEHLAPDDAEVAIALRRACDIGVGRGMPLDAMPVASDLLTTMGGVCHSMQPEIAPNGTRNVGSIRDFAQQPELLGSDPSNPRQQVVRR